MNFQTMLRLDPGEGRIRTARSFRAWEGGVDISLIKWMKTDGIGRICRNGLNFTERGFGIRGAGARVKR